MLNYMRWIMVIPASIGGWFVALVAGVYVREYVISLCPPEQLISGMCATPWCEATERALLVAGASLAALFAVIFAAILAPYKKLEVAFVAYIAGVTVALVMAWEGAPIFWLEFLGSILVGGLSVWAVYKLNIGAKHA